jgi:7-carboxy-7-deazaguanine synthase
MYNEDAIYPIAEYFVSPQGEGKHAGTLMQFIRFAGCNVGKRYEQEDYDNQLFPIYTNRCQTFDGRSFPCDTDYRLKERKTSKELVQWALSHNVETVLLTGGEPLMHDLTALLHGLKQNQFKIHVETSGTIKPNLNDEFWLMLDWVCVSPKKPFQDAYATMNIANEFKLLVDENFNWRDVPDSIKRKQYKVSLSPINDEDAINYDNVQRCLELQRQHPAVRITMQNHKLWGVR